MLYGKHVLEKLNNLLKITQLLSESEFELKEFDCNTCDFYHCILLPFLFSLLKLTQN